MRTINNLFGLYEERDFYAIRGNGRVMIGDISEQIDARHGFIF